MRPPITVTVLTLDEESKLPGCLETLTWADEILVLDSGSSDRTVEIAEAAGARVVTQPWLGFGAQKNRAAELATHDWILNVDADERVGADLLEAIGSAPFAADGYLVTRVSDFLGVPHRPVHRQREERLVRLYDRRRSAFAAAEVHEKVETPGSPGVLRGTIYHEGFRSIEDAADRLNRYSTLLASDDPRPFSPTRLVVKPLLRLGWALIAQRGLRDGTRGIIYAALWANHDLLVEAKRFERGLRPSQAFPRSAYALSAREPELTMNDALPAWAKAYAFYDARVPQHRGKGRVLSGLANIGIRQGEPITVSLLNGNQIVVSPDEGGIVNQTVGMTCLRERQFEPHVETAIREIVGPGDLAVDVGANIGYMTSVMAQQVTGSGQVLAFEPVPHNAQFLKRTLELNRHGDRVQIVEAAVGQGPGQLTLMFDRRLPGNASTYYSETEQAQELAVPVVTLDDELSNRTPALIKIDVQGHEMAVLRGAQNVLSAARPAVIFEYDPMGAEKAGWSLDDAMELLASFAPYEFFRLAAEGRREPLDSLRGLEGRDFGDVLAVAKPPRPA